MTEAPPEILQTAANKIFSNNNLSQFILRVRQSSEENLSEPRCCAGGGHHVLRSDEDLGVASAGGRHPGWAGTEKHL